MTDHPLPNDPQGKPLGTTRKFQSWIVVMSGLGSFGAAIAFNSPDAFWPAVALVLGGAGINAASRTMSDKDALDAIVRLKGA